MSAGGFLFLICTVACVAGAITTIMAKNPVRGAVGLLVNVVAIAGLFICLSAQFLAAIQLIVYAGAVVVLFVFVIMLLGPEASEPIVSNRARVSKAIGAGLLAAMAFSVLLILNPGPDDATEFRPALPDHGTVESVGGLLFSKGIVPFEIATALLIVAVVGAIAVARGKSETTPIRRKVTKDPRDLFVGPVHPRDGARSLPRRASQ